MQEKRRIEEMQMQLKMKELDIEQFMLSKEKEERVSLVLPSSTKQIWCTEVHQIYSTYFGERSGQIVCSFRENCKKSDFAQWILDLTFTVSWQGKPKKQVQIMKKGNKPFWKHMNW